MTAASTSFGDRLASVFAEFGRLCVGIDPHAHLLREWGLEESGAGTREFGLRVVDAVAGRAGIVKPQVAFFERYGAAGYAALEDVLAAARAAGILVIADAKRGDIDVSAAAYAAAFFGATSTTYGPVPGLNADALTVNPLLGGDSV
ncbi:MAG TPA: orotidine-5'-phosphate decarboxylase, partial [Diaminobutyricibacter sp.]